MDHKFRKEDRNRQDKAKKRDYREDLILETQKKASPERLAEFRAQLAYGKKRKEREDRLRAFRMQLVQAYQEGVFIFETRVFQFCWNIKEYIEQNKLESAFSQTNNSHRRLAAHDLKSIEAAIDKEVVWFELFFPRYLRSVCIKNDRIVPHGGIRDHRLPELCKFGP